jgi:hypothetical protein
VLTREDGFGILSAIINGLFVLSLVPVDINTAQSSLLLVTE